MVPATRIGSPVFASAAPTTQRRTAVNAFLRPPLKSAIPSFNAAGEEIDRDKFALQYQTLIDTLRQTVVADHVHMMDPLPNFESCRVSDLVIGIPDMLLPIPKFGMEHRVNELSETMRYFRAAGYNGSVQEFFQQNDDLRVCAGDMVYMPGLMLVAETPRTNSIAVDLIRKAHVHRPEYKAFLSAKVDFKGPNPPQLADCIGFGGSNTLVFWDDEYGNAAANVMANDGKTRPWYFCRVDPGVDFLTFNPQGLPKFDIICCNSSIVSIQSMAHAGLNPIPIGWSEPKKLGLTMRSVVCGLTFIKQGGGNVHNIGSWDRSDKRIHYAGEQKKNRGDAGSPFWAQIKNKELPPFVEQPMPRYAAPMHRDGQLATTPPPPRRP